MQIFRPLALAVTSALLLAGCGGGGSATGNASAPASPAAGGAAAAQVNCDLAPASLVNSALGTDLGAPSQTTAGSATACEYKGTKAGAVEIRIQTGDSAAMFAVERKSFDATGQRTKSYPGFGDEAFTNVKHMPLSLPDVNTLVTRQGSVEILVVSTASLTAEQTLEQQLFAKVK